MRKTLKRLQGVSLGDWSLTHVPGKSVTEGELRAMWRFRTSIFALKPSWDPEVDYAAFAAYCRRCQLVTRLWNAEGGLEGILSVYWRTERRGGERPTLVLPEYMFLSPDARRRAVLPRMLAETVPRCATAFLFGPCYFGGFAYPSGFLAAQRFVGQMWLQGEPTNDPHAEWVFDHLIEVAGPLWDAERQIKDMPTLPRGLSERWTRSQLHNPDYQRYVARCPDWASGYTLPVVGRITPHGALSRMGKHFIRRAARR